MYVHFVVNDFRETLGVKTFVTWGKTMQNRSLKLLSRQRVPRRIQTTCVQLFHLSKQFLLYINAESDGDVTGINDFSGSK